MQDLGTLGGDWSEAYAVSADGSVVVGMAEDASGWRRAFRWSVVTGMQNLAFKASHWLRVVVPGAQVYSSEVTGINFALTNGDVDGDNEVIVFDFGALVAAFGSMPGDANWNVEADLDGDEEVTLFDFGILVRNFGAIGDD